MTEYQKVNSRQEKPDLNFQKIADEYMNMELRTHVLKQALLMENLITELFKWTFDINKSKSKFYYSSNKILDVDTKMNILHDMGVLSQDDHSAFSFVMYFRNRFVHDVHYTSFESIFKVHPSKKKELNSYITQSERSRIGEKNLELIYLQAFNNLFVKCNERVVALVQKQFDIRQQRAAEIMNFYRDIEGFHAQTANNLNSAIGLIRGLCKENNTDTISKTLVVKILDDLNIYLETDPERKRKFDAYIRAIKTMPELLKKSVTPLQFISKQEITINAKVTGVTVERVDKGLTKD